MELGFKNFVSTGRKRRIFVLIVVLSAFSALGGELFFASSFPWSVSSAHADSSDEVVDLGQLESSGRPDWNPYQFTREPFFIVVPVVVLGIVTWHLRRRKRNRTLDTERAEKYFND